MIGYKHLFGGNHSSGFYRILTAILLLPFYLLTGCSFDEPVLPSWGVTVNVPIAQQTFVLGEELVNDSTIVVQGSDSLIALSVEGELDTMQIDAAEFSLGEVSRTQSFEIGEIELSGFDPLRTAEVSLGQLMPELQSNVVSNQTVTVPIPDTTLYPAAQIVTSSQFEALRISSGQLVIAIRNNLPLAVGPNASQPQGMTLTVTDDAGTTVSQVAVDQTIAPYSIFNHTVPLTGDTWVRAPLTVNYALPIAAGQSVDLNQQLLDSSDVAFDVTLQDLQLTEAIAVIEPQYLQRQRSLPLESEHRLLRADVAEGDIQLVFQNNTAIDAIVGFSIFDIRNAQSATLNDSIFVSAYSQNSLQLALTDHRIANFANPHNYLDSLAIAYTARTEQNSQMVHLKASDMISVEIALDSLQLNTFEGFVTADTFRIDPFEQEDIFDYEDLPSNIQLQDVDLTLTMFNEFAVENLLCDIRISGYHVNDFGQIVDSANIELLDQAINSGGDGDPGVSVLNISGQQVADFINIFPNTIRTTGEIRVSGDVAVNSNSTIGGSYAFSTPLKFQIDSEARLASDEELLTEEDIDEDLQKAAEDQLEEGSLMLEVVNHTPIGGSLRLIVSTDDSHDSVYDIEDPDPANEFIKEVNLTAATVNATSGYVNQSAVSEITLHLSQQELQLFRKPPLRIGYELILGATSGVVTVRAADFVRIGGLATINVKIEE